VAESELSACGCKGSRAISRAVVGHDAAHHHTEASVCFHDRLEEAHRTVGTLVGVELGVSHTRGIIDADVQTLPTHTSGSHAAVPGDSMARAIEAPELLDVEMDQLTGVLPLVSPNRL